MDKRMLDELSAKLAGLMPAANELRQETRAKIEQALKQGLKELKVLTREEFDAQARALDRAQQRVTELETLIADFESRLATLEQKHHQS
jgi:BMFP domain-containing protein YqiC